MKKNKSNLDEMQEMKLLKIEHNGCWFAYWALTAAILIQIVMGHTGIEYIGGECLVLVLLCVYLSVSCVKNGIWDRKLKPNAKTNVWMSLAAGGVMGLVWFITSYRNYHKLVGSIATFVFMFVSVFVLCFAALTLTTQIYKKRKNKIENQPEQDEE